MRKMNINILVIGIGIVVFFLLAVFFGLIGFRVYGNQGFGPNFASAVIGGVLGAAVSLAVVLVGFLLQRDSRSKALEPARYLFLRKDGEELKESYVAFIDTLRISTQNSVNLAGKSWEALKKGAWPDTKTIDSVQNDLNKIPISGLYNSQAVLDKYNRLRKSIEDIVHTSATAVFEGKENLIAPVLWEVDYNVHVLGPRLIQTIGQQNNVNLSSTEKPLKDAAISTGKLLINLCKLGKSIKLA